MDDDTVAGIKCHVGDSEGVFAAEEEEVAGLPFFIKDVLSALYLLAGVAGQDEAVHVVAELDESAAVEVLDGVASPHVRRAGETAGELEDIGGVGPEGRGALAEVGDVFGGYPAFAAVGEKDLGPASAGAGFAGLANQVAHGEVTDGVAVLAGLLPDAGVLGGAYPFGSGEPGVFLAVGEFVDGQVCDPAGIVLGADLDPVAVGLAERLHKCAHKHLVLKRGLVIRALPHKSGRQGDHRPAE